MIKETQETVYYANCSICEKPFEHSFEGWTVWFDKSRMLERMSDQEWHIGNGEQGIDGKCYCPECFRIDDEDVFHLILKEG